MATRNSPKTSKAGGIGSDAVLKRTGKSWDEWLRILDKAGAKKWDHKTIAKFVHDDQGCGPWWSQMVTVGYEQSRGLRKPHETPRGWQVGASKTIPVPVGVLYDAWADEGARTKWLGRRKITVRKATRNKSMRITWSDGVTNVEAMFYAKGPEKSLVSVQHDKLKGEPEVAKMRAFWRAALAKLALLIG